MEKEFIKECGKPVSETDKKEKQYITLFFAKERTDAEKKARTFALEFVNKQNLPVPDKNAHSTDAVRMAYDSAFTAAYIQQFEISFNPIDYFFCQSKDFIPRPLKSWFTALILMMMFTKFSRWLSQTMPEFWILNLSRPFSKDFMFWLMPLTEIRQRASGENT